MKCGGCWSINITNLWTNNKLRVLITWHLLRMRKREGTCWSFLTTVKRGRKLEHYFRQLIPLEMRDNTLSCPKRNGLSLFWTETRSRDSNSGGAPARQALALPVTRQASGPGGRKLPGFTVASEAPLCSLSVFLEPSVSGWFQAAGWCVFLANSLGFQGVRTLQ